MLQIHFVKLPVFIKFVFYHLYTSTVNMRQKYNFLFNGLLFSGLACFSYLFLVLYSDFTPQHLEILLSFWSFLLILTAFNIVGFGVLMIHKWQKRSFLFLVKQKEKLIMDCILTAILLFLMNYLVWSVGKSVLEIPAPFSLKGNGLQVIVLVWLIEMIVTNLTLTINFYRQLVILHERAEKFEESSIKAQYDALQNQLNPHFLFNSLNTLISEIEYDTKTAVLFTQRLSDVYRYILQNQQQRLVTFESELAFIDSYIFLHKVRLGDCIRIDNRVGKENNELKMPSLTLQLLVENVIKHNIINAEYPMIIRFDHDQADDRLIVTNEIRIKPNVITTGVGLKNLSLRYRLICDRDVLIENDEKCFTVKIPLLHD